MNTGTNGLTKLKTRCRSKRNTGLRAKGQPLIHHQMPRAVGGLAEDAAGRLLYFEAHDHEGKVHVKHQGEPQFRRRMLVTRNTAHVLPDYPKAQVASTETWARACAHASGLVRRGALVHAGEPALTKEALETQWAAGERRAFANCGARISAAILAAWLLHSEPSAKAFCRY